MRNMSIWSSNSIKSASLGSCTITGSTIPISIISSTLSNTWLLGNIPIQVSGSIITGSVISGTIDWLKSYNTVFGKDKKEEKKEELYNDELRCEV